MPKQNALQQHTAELRRLSMGALRERADALRVQIISLKFAGAAKEKNVKRLRQLRHDRARVLTVLNERQKT